MTGPASTDPPSPVVPSVGAVPVEMPEVEFDFTLTSTIAEAVLNGPGEWIGIGAELALLASVVREKVKPLIAARVQAELEAEDECPRTTCQQIAATASDVYCEVTGGQLSYPTYDARTILSHANDQTQKLIDDECAQVRAEERQRIAGEVRSAAAEQAASFRPDAEPYFKGRLDGLEDAARIVAGSAAVLVATPQRPEIVVLCGSTRFKDAFREAAKSEALAGRIVLTVSDLDPRPEMRNVNVPIDADTKARLDQLHRHKIDLADRVLVLNVGGYIGESTRSEIEYATAHGKPISYLEDVS